MSASLEQLADEYRRQNEESAQKRAKATPITMKHIIGGVFFGMWAFALTAAVVYYIIFKL